MLHSQLSFLFLNFISRPYSSEVKQDCSLSAIPLKLEAQDSPDRTTSSSSKFFFFFFKSLARDPLILSTCLQCPKRSLEGPLRDGKSMLYPAQQIHCSCGASRGTPSYCTRSSGKNASLTPPLTHASSFPRVESLTSPATTDPPKASSAATVAQSQHSARSPPRTRAGKTPA